MTQCFWVHCSLPPLYYTSYLWFQVDLVTEGAAQDQHETIRAFVQGTIADGAPVLPISAQLKYNVDVVCEYLCRRIPTPVRYAQSAYLYLPCGKSLRMCTWPVKITHRNRLNLRQNLLLTILQI